MRIAMYISPAHRVPPHEANILAPWSITAQIVDGLIDHGHTVLLFTASGSYTKAKLYDFGIGPNYHLKNQMNRSAYKTLVKQEEELLFMKMLDRIQQEPVDLIHIHHPIERLYNCLVKVPPYLPVIFTLHDPITNERISELGKLYSLGNIYFVSVSKAQQRYTNIPFVSFIYNGIDSMDFPFSNQHDDFLLAAGRFVSEKGFEDAVTVSKTIDIPVHIQGQSYKDLNEQHYFDTLLNYSQGSMVTIANFVDKKQLIDNYQKARALLFPIKWEEPFGLVMIESMACGTPVIAYNRGSVPEIIRDGLTGFIIDPDDEKRPGKGTWNIKKQAVEGLVEAVKRIDEIDRQDCRRYVEENFSIEKMVERYEQVYHKVIENNRQKYKDSMFVGSSSK